MEIRLNGEERTVPDGTTVRGLLQELDLDRDGIAVAVNTHVVPRSRQDEHVLEPGSRVEVIRAVGGG